MPSDPLSHLSPEQESAHKLAARELAKYCQDFSRWRESKGGQSSLEKNLSAHRVCWQRLPEQARSSCTAPTGIAKPKSIANPKVWD